MTSSLRNYFYVKVTETEIKLLTYESGTEPSKWDEDKTSGGIVKEFAYNQDTGITQATVENTPGTALPSTGGRGKAIFIVLGLLMLAASGAALWLCRRTTAVS